MTVQIITKSLCIMVFTIMCISLISLVPLSFADSHYDDYVSDDYITNMSIHLGNMGIFVNFTPAINNEDTSHYVLVYQIDEQRCPSFDSIINMNCSFYDVNLVSNGNGGTIFYDLSKGESYYFAIFPSNDIDLRFYSPLVTIPVKIIDVSNGLIVVSFPIPTITVQSVTSPPVVIPPVVTPPPVTSPVVVTIPADDPPKKKSGGGCSGDCTPPTFGKDAQSKQIVQGGFSFNGHITDVTDYHTEYSTITAHTNTTHNFTLKAYENNGANNIKWFQWGIVEEVGTPLSEAEVLATFYVSGGVIEEIVQYDKNNLIDIIHAETYVEECGYITSDCLELSFDVTFRDQLKNKVIVIQAMDNSRNADTKFMNEGIDTVGTSMNEPLLDKITASHGGAFYPQRAGAVELTLIDYKTDTWQDEYGYLWTSDNYKSFKIVDTIPVPLREPDKTTSVMTRQNSIFASLIIAEQDRAVLYFDSTKLISIPDESFVYDLPISDEQRQTELDIRITNEIARITPMVIQYDNKVYSYDHLKQYDGKTVAEIVVEDMAEKLLAQKDLLQKRLVDKEKYSN